MVVSNEFQLASAMCYVGHRQARDLCVTMEMRSPEVGALQLVSIGKSRGSGRITNMEAISDKLA